MKNDRVILKQLIQYCVSHTQFSAGIYVANHDRFEYIRDLLYGELGECGCIVKLTGYDGVCGATLVKSDSHIQIITMGKSGCRVPRANFMLVDEEIDEQVKEVCIYPWLVVPNPQTDMNPYPISHMEFSLQNLNSIH